jgi:hypothetical protein
VCETLDFVMHGLLLYSSVSKTANASISLGLGAGYQVKQTSVPATTPFNGYGGGSISLAPVTDIYIRRVFAREKFMAAPFLCLQLNRHVSCSSSSVVCRRSMHSANEAAQPSHQ